MINTELNNLNIDILTKLGINKAIINKLHKLKIKTIGDLNRIEHDIVMQIIDSDKTISCTKLFSCLELNLIDFTNKLGENITDNPAYELTLLHIQNRTYQEIAKKKNMSKEKIVQSIDRFLQSFYTLIDTLGDRVLEEKSCISISELEMLIKSKVFCEIILLAFKSHDTKWLYKQSEDVIVKKG